MTSSRWGTRGQVKNVKNSDESGWLQGGKEKGIYRNWISTAIISISVIRVQTVFQIGVWFCYKCFRLVSRPTTGVPDRCLVLL